MVTPRSVRPVQVLATILLAATLALAGCGANDKNSSEGDAKSGAAGAQRQGAADSAVGADAKGGGSAPGGAAKGPGSTPALTTNDIIRTASLTVQVKDVPKALDEARTTVVNAGGFVGNENTSRDAQGRERTRLVLRVPTEKYDEVLASLQGAGKLLDRTARAEDVTDQVVDVESRIRSQRVSVARVRELMDRATKLSDVVALEGELSSREAGLEALLARQASLKDRTSLATITLSLSETPVQKAAKDDRPGFMDALAGGWNWFVTLLRWIALAIGAALPFAVCAALLVLVWLRLVRPRSARRPASATAAPPVGAFPAARTAPEPAREQGRGEQD
ncbi:DUF4349 domain-containing protein [Streptomyces chiangmaiensis]|uniref:DUF4349 domain-containing protein n=1 Tax=Streptomyces chiangmaiensis TaxID=766497 RepID=A0ABU7F9Y3_9ACTN|nr:DUF4349 domain-containing protein [Streptomyces chiangmaiensis]MED7820986.1 DUF4349 domain-containing protein [Streptomyces chiangmaiensis]